MRPHSPRRYSPKKYVMMQETWEFGGRVTDFFHYFILSILFCNKQNGLDQWIGRGFANVAYSTNTLNTNSTEQKFKSNIGRKLKSKKK
jgi:hypothetical protein